MPGRLGTSGCVHRLCDLLPIVPGARDHLRHPVFEMKFKLFKTDFFDLILFGGRVHMLELIDTLAVLGMLRSQTAELFIRRHQVRSQFFDCGVLHWASPYYEFFSPESGLDCSGRLVTTRKYHGSGGATRELPEAAAHPPGSRRNVLTSPGANALVPAFQAHT
jgi:hypothetical protein